MIQSLKTVRGTLYDIADNCDFIEEHRAAGEGDRWYYDIHLSDGEIIRIFDPLEVRILGYKPLIDYPEITGR